jgi:four helix bundle protein
MYPFRRLGVWHKAHELALRCYQATSEAHWRRDFALVSQIRRAAFAIPANIAEGAGRDSPVQFARSLEIAIGSARELDYLLLLAKDLNLLNLQSHATLEARAQEVAKMTVAFRKTVRRKITAPKRESPSMRR